jgi:hypothetical protein
MAHSQLSLLAVTVGASVGAPRTVIERAPVTHRCRHTLLLSRAVVVTRCRRHRARRHHMAHLSAHLGLTSSPAGRGVHEALKGRRAHLRFRHEH